MKVSKYTIKLKELESERNTLLILIGNYDDLTNNEWDYSTIKKQLDKVSKSILKLG
jgi:hypothetical protein